jgi:hypothetical protein
MLRAIAAARKKNDRIEANKIATACPCDFLPECYLASTAIRERRRTLRYRNLLVRQMVQMKIKISTLLMEGGASYNKQRLHKAGYFRELLVTNPRANGSLVLTQIRNRGREANRRAEDQRVLHPRSSQARRESSPSVSNGPRLWISN